VLALALAAAAPFASLLVTAAMTPLPAELREWRAGGSIRVTDRDGRLLREVPADDGARAQWIALDDCAAAVPKALRAAEDRRFFEHAGVDPIALARAVVRDVAAWRVVSGGSTLTMQLARTLRPHRRTLFGKFGEMALALRIEASLSKHDILEQYLNRVIFGPSLRGIAAASRAYFDKPPGALSTAEAALLVGVVRGPSYYELEKHPDRAIRRRNRVLSRMLAAGDLTPEIYSRSLAEPVVLQKRASAFGAPHFVRAVLSGSLSSSQPGLTERLGGSLTSVETTIDSSLQRTAEAAAAQVVSELASKHVTAASVLVVDNESGDVLAYVGSPDFFDTAAFGQNDGVRALRQPGSTLKPFLYELAMEHLDWTGATVLPDIELQLRTASGSWTPRDYDERYRGPVRLREALGNSLNAAAVWTAEQVGDAVLLERLRALGFDCLDESAEYYGPGLALGDGEVTLLDLVRAYTVLARDGILRPLRFVRAVRAAKGGTRSELPPGQERAVLSEAAAAEVTDILHDHGARRASFGERTLLDFDFDVAVKTGTSKGYRDNWAVGYTRQVTVGVWVGNFDGSPMGGTSGITGAGPLFHAVMDAAMRGRPPAPMGVDAAPGAHDLRRVEVCALSGQAPGPACSHRIFEWMPAKAEATLPTCSFHERLRIDRRNGLAAGPGCSSAEVAMKDVERYPPEYAEWARGSGRPVVGESSPYCPTVAAPAADMAVLRIAHLADGARFAIDPDRPLAFQRVDLSVIAPEHVGLVRLRVDGTLLEERAAPYTFTWPLEAGDHILVAEADGVASSPPLRVHVRGL
jgi:penicillin-binding protein 1C